MDEANGASTLMFSSCKLRKYGDEKLSHPFMYKSIVEALQYVTLTFPDIIFWVNKACHYMSNLLEFHWSMVKRMLRYLSGTMTHGIILAPANTVQKIIA